MTGTLRLWPVDGAVSHGARPVRGFEMDGHRWAGRLLAGLATITLVAGCATGTTTPSPTATTMPSPTASLQPVAVREFRGMLPVVFTQSLVTGAGREHRDRRRRRADSHSRWTYRNESSDPRLAGTYDGVINVDQRQSDMSARL